MIKRLVLLLTLVVSGSVYALGTDNYSCPVIIAAAEIYLLAGSPASVYYQPALIHKGVSLSHSIPHGFVELNVIQLASQFSLFGEYISAGTLALNNKHISDKVLYLGYSKRIREIQFGTNVRYFAQKATGYNLLDAFTLNVGALWENGMFTHGITYSNISHTTRRGIELPSVFKYECKVAPFEKTDFAIALEKETRFDMRYGFGVSQKIADILFVNSGFLTNPSQLSAGMIVKVNKLEIGYGMRTHRELNWTHAIGVKYEL